MQHVHRVVAKDFPELIRVSSVDSFAVTTLANVIMDALKALNPNFGTWLFFSKNRTNIAKYFIWLGPVASPPLSEASGVNDQLRRTVNFLKHEGRPLFENLMKRKRRRRNARPVGVSKTQGCPAQRVTTCKLETQACNNETAEHGDSCPHGKWSACRDPECKDLLELGRELSSEDPRRSEPRPVQRTVDPEFLDRLPGVLELNSYEKYSRSYDMHRHALPSRDEPLHAWERVLEPIGEELVTLSAWDVISNVTAADKAMDLVTHALRNEMSALNELEPAEQEEEGDLPGSYSDRCRQCDRKTRLLQMIEALQWPLDERPGNA